MRLVVTKFLVLLAMLSMSGTLGAQADPHRQMIDDWMQQVVRGDRKAVIAKTEAALNGTEDPVRRADIYFVQARATILENQLQAASTAVEAFLKLSPADERAGELLYRLARAHTERADRLRIFKRAADAYPTSYWGLMAAGNVHQLEAIGKPFELDFTDAITGRPISLQKDFKGKPVVILFWATWCTDCQAEMPHWKELYAKYKPQGVEFIGVSLDEPEVAGGLAKLKRYVELHQIPWPQYYQGGERFLSPFSQGWGVSSSPSAFFIDANGLLHSTQSTGRLDDAIPALLAAAKQGAP